MSNNERIENIEGYPDYFVTSCGRVFSYKTNKFLKLRKDKDGYLYVRLYKDGKQKFFTIHRLVAQVYIPNPDNKPEVDHIDRIREHNYVKNLRWVLKEENQKNKKNPQREIVCVETGQIFESISEAARQFGLYATNICACCTGRQKTTGGYHFKFVEEGLK